METMIECKYFGVHESVLAEWEQQYYPLFVRGELFKMVNWLDANPKRRKKNYQRFIINWLNKEHAKIVRAQIESRAYARAGTQGREVSPEQHEENLRIIAELQSTAIKCSASSKLNQR